MTSACVKLDVYQPPMSLRTADTFVPVVFDASSQPPMASSKAAAPANARGVVAMCILSSRSLAAPMAASLHLVRMSFFLRGLESMSGSELGCHLRLCPNINK